MSETSDPYAAYHCKACGSLMGSEADCPVCDDPEEEAAALSQPAPCGPGLTEEERLALMAASDELHAEAVELSMSGYRKSREQYLRWATTIDNLLTRDAKADTVTLRREVASTLVDACRDFKMYSMYDHDGAKLAEAEAALAKGGERAS